MLMAPPFLFPPRFVRDVLAYGFSYFGRAKVSYVSFHILPLNAFECSFMEHCAIDFYPQTPSEFHCLH